MSTKESKGYIVRAYKLPQDILPVVKLVQNTKDLAISLAEVLLSEEHIHYVTIIYHHTDEDIITFKKELKI